MNLKGYRINSPVLRFVWRYMFFVLIVVCLLLSACGSRRVQTDILKQSDKSTEKIVNEGEVKKESSTTEESKSSEQVAKVNEKQEQRVTELYDSLGRLKQRITELVNSKDIDNSKKEESRSYIAKIRVDSIFNNTIYRTKVVTLYVKEKKSETSNLYWILALAFLGGLALLFGYLYLKTRRKLTEASKEIVQGMF